MNWKLGTAAGALRRKGDMAALQLPRAVCRATRRGGHSAAPPVLVNSIPKAGTHLLHAVAASLPGVRDYHSFVASVPSIVHRPRPPARVMARLGRIAPGELLRAHLWHSPEAAERLRHLNAVHLLVFRDPRDVVVSEAYYLAEMAPWHSLHRHFADRAEVSERVRLAIEGLPRSRWRWYPPVGQRLAPYVAWTGEAAVHAVRYEDLVGERQVACVRGVAAAYAATALVPVDVEAATERGIAAIREARPHTFRKGGSGGWRSVFTDEHRELFKHHGGELLLALGYEDDDSW